MTETKRILIADNDPRTRDGWREIIASWGFDVEVVADGREALQAIESYAPDVLLLELKLPFVDAIEILSNLRTRNLKIAVIVASEHVAIDDVVKTIKLGAYHFLCKPVDPACLKLMLHNASELQSIDRQNPRLQRQLLSDGKGSRLVARSSAMRQVFKLIRQVAASDASVIIVGESGTGKEVVAKTIHELSRRKNGPFLAMNCAALPETLLESELFGHERGAFTGADRRREGCFELAGGGTLVLDEITEMKVQLQAKLLRVLEDRVIRRIGGNSDIPLDVRTLATSNRDISRAIEENKLREDLFYRLNVFTIKVPPLREREEDIPHLVEQFVREFAANEHKVVDGFDEQCQNALKAYSWPGNVRQLRNVIRRSVVMAKGAVLKLEDLPMEVRQNDSAKRESSRSVGKSLYQVERGIIFDTLRSVQGNKVEAARILGVSLKTLYNRLDRYRQDET